jgi:hypothetical protein
MAKRRPPNDQERRYWLWVTKPEYYLEEDGSDRQELEPGGGTSWSGHADTRTGDLILLWRTRPRCDIGYLLEATSDASWGADNEWTGYWCDVRPLYKFENPVTISDLRDDPHLSEWGVLKASFQKATFGLDVDTWEHLNRLCARKNAGYSAFRAKIEGERIARPVLLEIDLENRIAADPGILTPFGYDLSIEGRQVICGGLGRIDLLCYDRGTKSFVVIELKNRSADGGTLTQIQTYMSWVEDKLPGGQDVRGIVVSRGSDARFRAILKMVNRSERMVEQIDVESLGFG